jgi:hypothetical protein
MSTAFAVPGPLPVYAVLSDGTAHCYEKKSEIPEGAKIFERYEELVMLDSAELDAITSQLLKVPVVAARSEEEARDRAWTAIMAAAAAVQPKKKHRKGARAQRLYSTTLDLANLDPDQRAKYEDLPPQAQACLQIFADSGQQALLEKEFRGLIEAKQHLLKTEQAPWRIFTYYRKLLRQVGFLEFEDKAAGTSA